MRPSNDPRWNRQYVEQRLKDKRFEAELKRIADQQEQYNSGESYWYGEYLEQQNRVTQLETENRELRLVIAALLSNRPTSRTTIVKEIW